MDGRRITLIKMNDPDPVPAGTKGTIDYVDDLGQLHVKWDNGRTLAVVPEIDKYMITMDAQGLLDFFSQRYSYIGHSLGISDIREFISANTLFDATLEIAADRLQDYILANNLQDDIQE